MPYLIIGVLISYLIGSIPTGYLMGRMLKGIDIREHGSGNIGATNLMRVVGKVPGVTVLILDVIKGAMPAVLLAAVFYRPQMAISLPLFRVLLGLSAVSGHIWTIFLKFKGGKGVATAIGVLMGLAPLVAVLGLLVWLIVALLFKYVSLASLVMAVSLPFLMFNLSEPVEYVVLSLVLCAFIFYRHRANIRRLINGTEYRLGKKVEKISKILP